MGNFLNSPERTSVIGKTFLLVKVAILRDSYESPSE